MNYKLALRPLLVVAGLALAGHAAARITLYDGAGFRGRILSSEQPIPDLGHSDFNDRASVARENDHTAADKAGVVANLPATRLDDQRSVSGPPRYWEVTYAFGGLVHHLQMSAPPGRTILVNQFGEPRKRG